MPGRERAEFQHNFGSRARSSSDTYVRNPDRLQCLRSAPSHACFSPMSVSGPPQAIALARRAHEHLDRGETRDAAWHALYAVELDRGSGLAWSAVARTLGEVANEPLATLAARYALELGIPDDIRARFERHHRIDLWTRGLLMHAERRSILPASEFEDAKRFDATSRLNSWFDAEIREWEGLAPAAEAARKLVGALSDAYGVPEVPGENPLRSDKDWNEKTSFLIWKAEVLARGLQPADALRPLPAAHGAAEPTVMSDYWMEQEIVQLAASGLFEEAIDHAKVWSQLRPAQMKPKASLLRVQHAAGREEERDQTALAIVGTVTNDLNELEEARVALGELRLWREQIHILDRMDKIAPEHSVILANRGVALIELGERERGRADLERSLALDPDNAPALANLGLEKMREDNYVAARPLLEHAVVVAPDQVMARVYLAACKNNQGDRSGAIAELEAAVELEPGHEQAKQMLEEIRSFVVKSKPS
jgi:tetratricopeptide (TPR) repeat protein